MILIDVDVPALDACYDLRVNENATGRTLLYELTEMIFQWERLDGVPAWEALSLFHTASGGFLLPDVTLAEACIRPGDKLILL